jgi:DNA-binding NarL/FixJ family response regulator
MVSIQYKNIFVVDDNKMFSQMLKDHLSQNPMFKVTLFKTGEDCLKNLYQNPDIIILDYYLNDVSKEAADGLEILTEIKRNLKLVHVIMLSSQERYGIALQSISKGAEQYVVKDKEAFSKIDAIIRELN